MFNLSKNEQLPAKIKVLGVGGCGGNILNIMVSRDIPGVEFWALNTDAQALALSKAPEKIQLGIEITGGKGTGGNPEIGRQAAEESIEEIKSAVGDADLVFIVAGMGKGTGTGASPVVASVAKEGGALTVAVVTKPFDFEGPEALNKAEKGISELYNVVDTLLVLPNEKLAIMKNATLKEALGEKTAEVPANAVQGIAELLIKNGFVNLDFNDLARVMKHRGKALLGIGTGEGENRAKEAVQNAIHSPMLEDVDISLAKAMLVNLTVDENEFTMQEMRELMDTLREHVSDKTEVLFGCVFEKNLGSIARVTLIATGIEETRINTDSLTLINGYRHIPRVENAMDKETVIKKDDLDIPAFLRRQAD